MLKYQAMLEHRGLGIFRCCKLLRPSDLSHDEILKRLGLNGSWTELREVNQEEAKEILTLFLWKNAAYQSKLMPLDEAKKYVLSLPIWHSQFSYFTNGGWISHYDGAASWMSMTEAAFGGGGVALSERLVACYWFEDEDEWGKRHVSLRC
jgi:hypothetical protein